MFYILTCNKMTRRGYWEVYDFVQIPGFGDIVQWQYCPLTHAAVVFLEVFGGIICIKHGRTYCVSWWEKVAGCKWTGVKSNNLFIWSVTVNIWKLSQKCKKQVKKLIGTLVQRDIEMYKLQKKSWKNRQIPSLWQCMIWKNVSSNFLVGQFGISRFNRSALAGLWPKVWPKEAGTPIGCPPTRSCHPFGARISL